MANETFSPAVNRALMFLGVEKYDFLYMSDPELNSITLYFKILKADKLRAGLGRLLKKVKQENG